MLSALVAPLCDVIMRNGATLPQLLEVLGSSELQAVDDIHFAAANLSLKHTETSSMMLFILRCFSPIHTCCTKRSSCDTVQSSHCHIVGRNPAPVNRLYCIAHFLVGFYVFSFGFIHPRWCKISCSNSRMSMFCPFKQGTPAP